MTIVAFLEVTILSAQFEYSKQEGGKSLKENNSTLLSVKMLYFEYPTVIFLHCSVGRSVRRNARGQVFI